MRGLQLRKDPGQIATAAPDANVGHGNTIVGAQNPVIRKSCARESRTTGKQGRRLGQESSSIDGLFRVAHAASSHCGSFPLDSAPNYARTFEEKN